MAPRRDTPAKNDGLICLHCFSDYRLFLDILAHLSKFCRKSHKNNLGRNYFRMLLLDLHGILSEETQYCKRNTQSKQLGKLYKIRDYLTQTSAAEGKSETVFLVHDMVVFLHSPHVS